MLTILQTEDMPFSFKLDNRIKKKNYYVIDLRIKEVFTICGH